MFAYLVAEFGSMCRKKTRGTERAAPLGRFLFSARLFQELLVKEVGEHEQHQKNQHHHVANLLAGELVGLGHPGHEIDQIADQDVVVDLGERSRRFGPDRLEYEALPVLAGLIRESAHRLSRRSSAVCRSLPPAPCS